jgi:hypothetical protein
MVRASVSCLRMLLRTKAVRVYDFGKIVIAKRKERRKAWRRHHFQGKEVMSMWCSIVVVLGYIWLGVHLAYIYAHIGRVQFQ